MVCLKLGALLVNGLFSLVGLRFDPFARYEYYFPYGECIFCSRPLLRTDGSTTQQAGITLKAVPGVGIKGRELPSGTSRWSFVDILTKCRSMIYKSTPASSL